MTPLADAVIVLAAGTLLLGFSVWAMVRLRRHLAQLPNPVSPKRLAEMHVIDTDGEQ